ncbi:glycosyltransferase family 2 protein [Tamlana sp. 62-3]|uniref:Glycosyltransferase family 2 protein n=1 Tax=Neotamlana sargassicola TaxID=2883125 RepID=A0A9X1I9E9_9FLAO|nr:glycosyltransferase family 2 protein [Tamlana sargassicola]MCB4809185.1 glycosyltransferase family 2 protein [Tamlana sargassicola]
MKQPEISVIISTYNAEAWLEKVMWSYHKQSFKNFEMVIADDGSKQPTFSLIEKMQKLVDYPIIHVWHEDNGFQKSQILNKAVLKCNADYILMSDGDCMAREDFVQVHVDKKEPGYFLSGGYFMLPMDISKAITKDDIFNQNPFNASWLKLKGLKSSFKNNKLTAKGFKAKFLNAVTPTTPSWNGHNASGWKKDILAINGFDERMQYGGQDRELGERLFNYGIKSKQIRYSAICVHLDHPRGYKTQESINKNLAIRATTKNEKLAWTDYGIVKKA